ncbi:DsbA family protein [Fructilactobacillus cliffordii]|uniref:DsbA family protein n=1 Tax=Fructilactobacillus cliffordii TaxID=2940299 RepID=A0A9Q8ZS10_9LACO|nr:DsbA family protein [Fructilactobacillus cliffordii]USS86377.1 DsbA family protein [Fructilactobacillus cliffordii]USS89442.1 DsbA family protein [Fructilactobacillus cliffordii]
MIEMYLFVEPTCSTCLTAEQAVTKVADNLTQKVRVKFIPYLQLGVINSAHHQLDYQITLDYKAALFQGCKKGREFLQHLQTEIITNQTTYSEALAEQMARTTNLDLEMFQEDRASNLPQSAFKSDQELIREMGVEDHDNLVIFNCASCANGLLIKDLGYQHLHTLCTEMEAKIQKESGTPNLRVL